MSDEETGPRDDTEELDLVETVTATVGDDGTVVVDDLVAVVDGEGAVLATDETIAVQAPDGRVVVDEVVSVADGRGSLVAVDEQTEEYAASSTGDVPGEDAAPRRRLGRRLPAIAVVVLAVVIAIIVTRRRQVTAQTE
ncbi:MAG TPA: hypothetical protein VGF22_12770 [Acidimicrobiales bacterium]|jgi:hypothetical protein